jgi:signal transduction histidine kinase
VKSNNPVILLVDDSLTNLAFLNTILQQNGYQVLLARTGEKALTIAKREKPDLILLDVVMSGWDGYETCRRIKSDDSLILTPVLFLSELKNAQDKLRAFAAGGVDYVHKSFQKEELLARVQTHVELYHLREKLEQKIAEREQQILAYAIELEQKIEIRTAQVNQAKEMAEATNLSKSQFLAKMSHELRTFLNTILGYTEMLMEDAHKSKFTDFIKDLTRILVSGKHLLGLVDEVLDLSKIESDKIELHLETFPVENLLNEIIAIIQPLAEKKANLLEVKIVNALGEITADLTRTRQILFNLLSNAAKFTENGKIGLEVKRQHDLGKEYICFRISDDGIGMTPEQQSKLFQAFTQVNASINRRFGGTGLGLAITKQLIEKMGGEIQVNSEFGQGTTFIVHLPVQVQLEKATPESTKKESVIENSATKAPEKIVHLPIQVEFEEAIIKPLTEEKLVAQRQEKVVHLPIPIQFEETIQESITEKPVTQKPVAKKRIKIIHSPTQVQLKKPIEKSITKEPVTKEPVVEKSIITTPVKNEPAPEETQTTIIDNQTIDNNDKIIRELSFEIYFTIGGDLSEF